jgi:acetyltransferase-like isoleucine patch superfamily enzyme
MQIKLSQCAPDIVRRDAEIHQTGFAQTPGKGIICTAATPRFLRQAIANPDVVAVIVPPALEGDVPSHLGLCVDDAPLSRFYKLHNDLVETYGMGKVSEPMQDDTVQIHPSAIVGNNVRIGARVTIGPGAIVDNCILEDDVAIGPGAIIGADGHFFKDFDGVRVKVAHAGLSVLHKGVQVLAAAIVQRGVFENDSRIGTDTVIGPKVLVAHGVKIGPRCILAGGSQIAGFTTLGCDVWIGPGAVVSNLLEIGDAARIEVGAVVAKSVPAGQRQSGAFAAEHIRNLRFYAQLRSAK